MGQAAALRVEETLFLGRYRPVRPLGSGGAGTVWLSRDERSGREVAVKIVPREGKAGSRARREAQAMSRLDHARCLRAYACGRDADNVYIAYEYVAGKTFREALRAGELTDDAALEAAAQVLDALAHAHERGVVHRDVKPANVLLADGDGVSVRILDFGLAQMADAEPLTAVGDVPGTLAYIAPERLRGDDADAAADVYSVGVMLYEALAGAHPFWRTTLAETGDAILEGAPPLADRRPDLPTPVLAAVDRAVAVDPARRPSAAKLARSLRRARGDDGGTAAAVAHTLERRFVPPALAGLYAGAATTLLPFFPAHWPAAIAAGVAALTFFRPRVGVAAMLAAPVLPLGNASSAVALLYAAAAVAWLVAHTREPERATLVALGPLLGGLGALAALPLLVRNTRSATLRALEAGVAVLAAVAVSGLRRAPLPLTADQPPVALRLAGSHAPAAAARVLATTLADRPALVVAALVLAAAAAALPLAERRGLWGLATFGTLFLAALLLPVAGVHALPVVAAAWLTVLVLVPRT